MLKKLKFLLAMFVVIMSMTGCKRDVDEPLEQFTITYESNGHATAPEAKKVDSGYKLTSEDLPVLSENGFIFEGWKLGADFISIDYEVTTDITLKAEWTQIQIVSTPVFSIEEAVEYGDKVEITCATEGAEIFYTTDGSTPTAESTKYTKPVAITADCTIKAIAVKSEMQDSVVVEKSFTVKKYTITFDADGHGTAPEAITGKHKGEKVTLPPAITATGFTFESWSDGTDTFAAGTDYTVNGTVTIKATWTDWNTVATPVFSVAAGEVDYGDKVTITCATEGAEIFYTTDGTEPTAGSKKYENEEIEITAATTIKAIATKAEMNTSTVAEKTYTIKLYTVTFDADGHGIVPKPMKGYKGQTITLPAKIKQRETGEDKGWEFWYWNDGTTNYDAETNYTVNGDVTFKAVWNEMYVLTDYFKNTYPENNCVCFKWNMAGDMEKAIFTYVSDNGEKGGKTVNKTDSECENVKFSELNIGIKYTFTITVYLDSGYAFKPVIINIVLGGIEGNPTNNQKQGAKLEGSLRANWMADTGNLMIDDGNGTKKEIAKTSEIIVVPTGTKAMINTEISYGYIFAPSRKVRLSPFVMSQYEVTRELFKAVMGETYYSNLGIQAGTNGTEEENPVTQINWLDAIKFCNKLSNMCGLAPVYSCNGETDSDKLTDADKIQINLKSNGYRLPTEAEWEFSARGGNPNADEWKYNYSGSDTAEEVAWFNSSGTNIVGGMNKANKLELYDMSGNVREWCNDRFSWAKDTDDNKYKDSENYVKDPMVVTSVYPYENDRVLRGFCFGCDDSVTETDHDNSDSRSNTVGFRLVRSTEVESN